MLRSPVATGSKTQRVCSDFPFRSVGGEMAESSSSLETSVSYSITTFSVTLTHPVMQTQKFSKNNGKADFQKLKTKKEPEGRPWKSTHLSVLMKYPAISIEVLGSSSTKKDPHSIFTVSDTHNVTIIISAESQFDNIKLFRGQKQELLSIIRRL
ncbi:hypothetical protein PoB_006235600 [Plakobranchus ocellatus]|uniref:Uncharacterized protein n=1 Tax=Plakobranchus ocellatus TaxID=259542 RepID=A0AAV4CVY2_9GAST|nr:hypothetical protein PoB_006235600 [Plakobranchus ocellatus]